MFPGGMSMIMGSGRAYPLGYARYTMDNISGSTLVSETGSYDGTISGASVVTGRIGNALSFDGVNDSVSVASVPAFGATHTLSGWFKPPTATPGSATDDAMFTITNGSNSSITVYWDSTSATFRGKARYYQAADRGQVDWRGALSLDTARFYFLVVDVSGTAATSRLYDDTGSMIRAASATLSSAMANTGTNTLYLGQGGGGSAWALTVLDDFMPFTRLLTTAEKDLLSTRT